MFPAKPFGKTVGQVLSPVMKPICKNAGFVQAELVLDWAKIVGESIAAQCTPVHVVRECLIIKASRALAAQLVYEVPTMLERIRRYFGQPIVSEIRFVDAVIYRR